ncbi:MAG: RNA-binding transcriptional accessory protein [Myxococcales bacterium]|nr:RNA-binding transcriptional accessory protein [Myxococcales bacterium]
MGGKQHEDNGHADVIARSLQIAKAQVAAALALFDEGATLPFVARYRKERTGGLDEVQLRAILAARDGLVALDKRKDAVLAAISGQGRLTPALEAAIRACDSLAAVEDLYAPYKSKRKTRADMARERGLEPLARRILAQPRDGDPAREARTFVSAARDVPDVAAALQGARDIVAEELATDADLRLLVREAVERHGVVSARAAKKGEGAEDRRFDDYRAFDEAVGRIPSHRWLAVARGEAEGALKVTVRADHERSLEQLLRRITYLPRSPFGAELRAAADDGVKRLLMPAAERAVRAGLSAWAEEEAREVFAKNLDALLMAAPYGARPVLGVDPGIRTGCKCAMVDGRGALVGYETLWLAGGRGEPDRAGLAKMLRQHRPDAVAVGNGTGGREAEAVVREVAREVLPGCVVVSVSEAGASVYSASELAGEELPGVDLTVRGAVSIARRLQDPLAELVKVPPQSIGVGQYQHDLDESGLARRLGEVVESAVNRVGVDVNTASPALLAHVAGIGPKLAAGIVAHRATTARGFGARRELLAVSGLGAKTFEQCAGFLRVRGGKEPLDASAVHPERYALVRQLAKDAGTSVAALVGASGVRQKLGDLRRYEDAETGRATLDDIVAELERPGRDPRATFEAVAFRDDVREIGDLEVGMVLAGIVTNVTAFGAFVDVGVHQDGLVHISELADRFVKDPHEVVAAGQRVRVKVLEVDAGRKRVSLSRKGLA